MCKDGCLKFSKCPNLILNCVMNGQSFLVWKS